MRWEEFCYEILDYEWNFHKWKLLLFHIFREFSFLKKYICVNKETLLIFDWNKYTSNNILLTTQ